MRTRSIKKWAGSPDDSWTDSTKAYEDGRGDGWYRRFMAAGRHSPSGSSVRLRGLVATALSQELVGGPVDPEPRSGCRHVWIPRDLTGKSVAGLSPAGCRLCISPGTADSQESATVVDHHLAVSRTGIRHPDEPKRHGAGVLACAAQFTHRVALPPPYAIVANFLVGDRRLCTRCCVRHDFACGCPAALFRRVLVGLRSFIAAYAVSPGTYHCPYAAARRPTFVHRVALPRDRTARRNIGHADSP